MSIVIKGNRIGSADVIDVDIVECGFPRHVGIVRVGEEIRQWVDGFNRAYMHDVRCDWGDGYVEVTVALTGAVSATECKRVNLS